MANKNFWWVNQGRTYELQRDGNYLWAPQFEKDGGSNRGFSNMLEAEVGDIFFVNYKSTLYATGIIRSKAYEANRPHDFPDDQNTSSIIGWKIDADYFEIPAEQRVSISEFIEVFNDTPSVKSPFGSDGKAKQKLYLNDLRYEDGKELYKRLQNGTELKLLSSEMDQNEEIQDGRNYIARITWNDKAWQKPSGSKVKHESMANFTSEYGYGHEEWLFGNRFLYDGFAYGFIEGAFRKDRRDFGKTFNVMLYTISKARGWYFVGEIEKCEILTEETAKEAMEFFQKTGEIQNMIKDIEEVEGNPALISSLVNGPRSIFSVRFKPENLKIYERPEVIPQSSEIRTKYIRYHINEIKLDSIRDETEKIRKNSLKVVSGTRSVPEREIILNYLHNEMQNELMQIFSSKFKKAVKEFNNIDIYLEDEKKYLIEIKSSDSPRLCIREALGQLMEYAFYSSNFKDPQMIIIGPNKMSFEDLKYIEKLNGVLGIRIHYCHYKVGSNVFDYSF